MPEARPRIAIVGSCITRDLWPIRGGGADDLLYVSRTGLASLLAAPLAGFEPSTHLPGDLHGHEHRALVADLQKTALATLAAWEPSHIIFDFIDERFDLLSASGTLVTRSAELIRSGYLARPQLEHGRIVPRLSGAADDVWLDGAAEFAALLASTSLRRATLILHSARWADEQRLPDGGIAPVRDVELVSGQPVEIAPYNDLLARQEAAFRALLPQTVAVEADTRRLADPQHRWGLSPFHYTPEYYDAMRAQLSALGLAAAFSAPGDAPSVPAA